MDQARRVPRSASRCYVFSPRSLFTWDSALVLFVLTVLAIPSGRRSKLKRSAAKLRQTTIYWPSGKPRSLPPRPHNRMRSAASAVPLSGARCSRPRRPRWRTTRLQARIWRATQFSAQRSCWKAPRSPETKQNGSLRPKRCVRPREKNSKIIEEPGAPREVELRWRGRQCANLPTDRPRR